MSISAAHIRTALLTLLTATFGLFSIVLAARGFAGHDITWPVPVRSPLNVESFVAVSSLTILLIRAERGLPENAASAALTWRDGLIACVLLGACCVAAFGSWLSTPFVFDDYAHVVQASAETAGKVGRMFIEPQGTAYRPVGFASFFLNFKLAHFDPFGWHLGNLIVHVLNCGLVYVLLRQLRFSCFTAGVSALIFAVHGTRSEPVCWADARFDLLAALFVFAALVCTMYYVRNSKRICLPAAAICAILAFATKESSFCLPFLPLMLIPFCLKAERQRLVRLIPWGCALAALVFWYRWRLIGGIGGYLTAGHPDVLNLSVLRTVKGIGWRLWAMTFFPLNWSDELQVALAGSLVIFLAALATAMMRAQARAGALACSLGFIVIAALPVQHLLLLGADLSGARFLYLPLAGLAIFWAIILERLKGSPALQWLIAAGLIAFNTLALEHNLRIWREVAYTSKQVCTEFGHEVANVPGQVIVYDVPYKQSGVYFLSNGFPQCVQQNSGVPASRILVANGDLNTVRPGSQVYVWDPRAVAFKKVQ